MTPNILLQQSATDAAWAMGTIIFYIVLAALWSARGYYHNHKKNGEEWNHEKALPALVSGALIGLGVVWSGQPLNSEYVIAVSGFLIPFLDKVWTMVRTSYDTATEMYEEGESMQSIALEIAQVVDREVDKEDVERVIEEYERRFGPLDPSQENLNERSEKLREDYEGGGVVGAFDGAQQPGPEDPRVDEPVPDVEDDGNERAPAVETAERDGPDDSDVVRDGP